MSSEDTVFQGSQADAVSCTASSVAHSLFGLRVASIFIIMLGSTIGALFPILARRSSWLLVPKGVFDFAKFFGSGVIIATAFIHLLAPALEALGSECLPPAWHEYPYALALCLFSIFCIFCVELFAFRWGTAKLARRRQEHDAHGHAHGSHAAHGPEGKLVESGFRSRSSDDERSDDLEAVKNIIADDENAMAQVIGVIILEFGVALHSVLIGLTLAVDPDFKILFVVLVFHQTFEGLGIGSRLAYMKLPPRFHWVPVAGAILFGITTPVGIAAGLAIRTSYNPDSATSSIVSGVLDSLSAGILIYTGLVELLAHEFIFNKEMMNASNFKVAYSVGSMLLGCAVMALLGKWA
ncbi:Zinc/iron permease [Infundibulicybe gibba]|nr:Zinc/iron permease [Infundibulicybe gibba]